MAIHSTSDRVDAILYLLIVDRPCWAGLATLHRRLRSRLDDGCTGLIPLNPRPWSRLDDWWTVYDPDQPTQDRCPWWLSTSILFSIIGAALDRSPQYFRLNNNRQWLHRLIPSKTSSVGFAETLLACLLDHPCSLQSSTVIASVWWVDHIWTRSATSWSGILDRNGLFNTDSLIRSLTRSTTVNDISLSIDLQRHLRCSMILRHGVISIG